MANSYEIAQMFAQQNSMFSGQNQFAQSIGVPAPPSYATNIGIGGGAGIGATGFKGPGGGGGFNYGPSGAMGYGPGNSLASGAMAAGSAGISAGSMALGAASMLGVGGKIGNLGAMMDPIAWGAAGYARAGVMGAVGMGAAPVFAGMAASHAIGSMVTGGQQQSQMNTMLGSQYQFLNPSTRTGSGFSRDDAKSIGDMTRSMSHIPEMMTSFEELSKIMGKMKSSGAMQGVRSAADFQARFREAIGTIRETAKALGTTMEEAEQFFTQSRGSGFYGRASQLKNVTAAQFTSGVTGATIGQVTAAQQGGADMAMNFGARRGLGATAVSNIASNIGLAQASGKLRDGMVEDVTGMQGPEAALALSQKMFAGMMRFGQSAPGRLAMAGMMKFEGDKAIGVDEDMVKKFNSGQLTNQDLKDRASHLTNNQKISFQARQSDLIASLAGQMGPGGMSSMMRRTLGDGRGTEATNLVLQRYTGMSAGELDVAQGMEGVSGDGMEGAMARLRQNQAQMREKTSPSAVLKKLKTKLHGETFGKLESLGASIHVSLAKAVDNFIDDAIGTNISALTEDRAKAISQAFTGTGSKDAQAMMRGLSAQSMGGGGGISGSTSIIAGLAGGLAGQMGAQFLMGGGKESITSRALTSLGGGTTAGMDRETVAGLLGTSDSAKQTQLLATLKEGKFGGGGAQDAITDIISEGGDDLKSKNPTERLRIISEKIESRVNAMRATEKYGLGSSNSDAGKALLAAADSAEKNRVSGVSLGAQIAIKNLGPKALQGLGGDEIDVSKAQDAFKRAGESLTETIGTAAAGFGNKDALKAAIGDQDIKLAIANGDLTKAQELLNAKKVKISSKDMPALKEAVDGFINASRGKDQTQAVAAATRSLGEFERTGNRLALGEGMRQLGGKGQDLIESAGQGVTGELQRKLGEAIKAGPGGNYQSAFEEYSKHLQGLGKDELKEALSSGGRTAQLALDGGAKIKGLANKSFKDAKDIAAYFGVSDGDVKQIAGDRLQGGNLSKEQIEKLSMRGASQQNIIEGIAKPKDASESREDRLIKTLNHINDTQILIATHIGVLPKDRGDSPNTAENANANQEGKTSFGGKISGFAKKGWSGLAD